eukprot:jgi/Picsp_1/6322/NSC_03671-R1_protein
MFLNAGNLFRHGSKQWGMPRHHGGLAYSLCHSIEYMSKPSLVTTFVKGRKGIKTLSRRGDIELIITDVDGTLLNSKQELTPEVFDAIKRADEVGVPFMIATGKAVGPWIHNSGILDLPQLSGSMPQLFLQGLYIRDSKGGTLHSQTLSFSVIMEAMEMADEHGLSFVVYCHDRILCRQRNVHVNRLVSYGEPAPEAMEFSDLVREVQSLDVYKVMFMGDDDQIRAIRPTAAEGFSGKASLTTALPGMLEILPIGASKGAGVKRVLEEMGISPERCMALGDGENDIEMLRLCGLSVAMGNAVSKTKDVADVIVPSNDEHGVAYAIEKYVLQK